MTRSADAAASRPASQSANGGTDNHVEEGGRENESLHYRCDRCGATYPSNLLAQIHVNRVDDEVHTTEDDDSIEIEAVTDDGEVIDSSPPETDIDPEEVTIDGLPNDLFEKHKYVVLTAIKRDEETRTALLDPVSERLEQEGFDPLSYSRMCQVLREFFNPNRNKQTASNAPDGENAGEITEEKGPEPSPREETTALADLQPRQQAILVTKLAHPERSPAEIATHIGVSSSYPDQILTRFENLYAELRSELLKRSVDVEDIVRERFPEDDLRNLRRLRYLDDDNVPVDVESLLEESGAESQPELGSVGRLNNIRSQVEFYRDVLEQELDRGVAEENGRVRLLVVLNQLMDDLKELETDLKEKH